MCPRFRAFPWIALVACGALLSGSCSSTPLTELVVRVDTTMKVPCELQEISIDFSPAVLNDEMKPPPRFNLTKHLDEDVLPIQLTVVAEAGQVLDITVQGWKTNSDEPVAIQTGQVTVRGGKSTMVEFNLEPGSTATPVASALEKRSLHALNICEETCNQSDDDGDSRIDEGLSNCDVCSMINCGELSCYAGACREEEVTRYSVSANPRGFTNACTTGNSMPAINPGSSNGSVKIPFPSAFNFLFYGRPVDHVWVGADGWISFDDQNPALSGDSASIDLTGTRGNAIYAFWDELRLQSRGSGMNGKVCWSTLGSPDAPSSIYITWNDVCFEDLDCDDDDSLMISVELTYDNQIYIAYGDKTHPHQSALQPDRADGSMATIGVVDMVPRACTVAQCGTDGKCKSGDRAGQPCGFTAIDRLSTFLAAPGATGNHTLLFKPAK